MSTNNLDDLNSSDLFTRILLQSNQYSLDNSPSPMLQPDAGKLLVQLATLFAEELVSQASSASQIRQGHSIDLNDIMTHHYRINGSMIQQYSGKPVSLIGTVSKVHPAGNVIDLETSDKQHIVVRLNDRADVSAGSIIEVLGNVDNRNQIVCDNIIAFEPEQTANFDMDMYNQAIMLFQHYPQDYLVHI